jgi:hypothetical protein
MTTKRMLATLAMGFLGAIALSACSQSPLADDSFSAKIPSALEASDLGITESYAEKGVDGLTTHLTVGATFDRSDLSTADVQKLIATVVENNTISVRYLELSVEDPAGDDIDIAPQLKELGADPLMVYNARITMDEATAIAAGNKP